MLLLFPSSSYRYLRYQSFQSIKKIVSFPTVRTFKTSSFRLLKNDININNNGNENNQKIIKERIYTIPNAITLARILSSPIIGMAILYDMKMFALGGCVVSAFSDWLDGYIAKNYDQESIIGSFLDPVADKVLIGSLSIALAMKGLLPVSLVGLVLSRDVMLLAGTFMLRATEKPEEASFFDTLTSATFSVSPSQFSRANSGIQFLLLSVTLSQFCFDSPSLAQIEPLWWLTAVTTIGSGLGYVVGGAGIRRLVAIKK